MTQNEDGQASSPSKKTAIYKKWWFWAIVIIVLIGIAGVGSSQDEPDTQANETGSVQAASNEEDALVADEDISPESFKGVEFSRSNVRNDVTGTWKISSVAEAGLDPEEYALDYYALYMSGEDSAVEGIINFSDKTTTAINKSGGVVYVTVHEYVDGEEHDAKTLFSGDVLKEFQMDPQTGEIETLR